MKKILFFAAFVVVNFVSAQEKIPFNDISEISPLALKSAQEGDFNKTLELLDRVNKNDSSYCSVLVSKSYYYLKLERYEDALTTAEEGLKRKCPDNTVSFYTNAGVALLNNEDYSGALRTYEEAIELFPKNAMLWNNKGVILEKLNRTEEAVQAYKAAIFYDPTYTNPHVKLGDIFYRQKRMTQALMCFNMYLLLAPDGENAYSTLEALNNIAAAKNPNVPDPELEISHEDLFKETDLILNNRIALNDKYKVDNKVNIALVKQNHIMLEQLKNLKGEDGDFWSEVYLPAYQWIANNDLFDEFTYAVTYSVRNEEYKNLISKNTDNIKEFLNAFVAKWTSLLADAPEKPGDGENGMKYFYENSAVQSVGKMDKNLNIGEWKIYNENGQLSTIGSFDKEGKKTGQWLVYNAEEKLEETAYFEDDQLNGENITYYSNEQINIFTGFKEDELEGEYLYYNNNGALLQKKYFSKGKLEGPFVSYFEVGEELPEFKIQYKENEVVGTVKEYYANGKLFAETSYSTGVQNGPEKRYHSNGQLYSEIEYKEGQPIGKYTSYFPNGKKMEEGEYVDGELNARFTTYYDNGNIESIGNFSKGVLEGEYKYYDRDGKPYYDYEYKKGEIIAYKFYDKSGAVIKEDKKKAGEFNYIGYSPYGNKTTEGIYNVSGGKTGIWKFYTKNGVLQSEGDYENNELQGKYLEYYSDGKIAKEQFYQDGVVKDYTVEYHLNGKMKNQGWYKDGASQGEWRFYYQDGTPESVNYFHNGEMHGRQDYYSVDGKLYRSLNYEYGKLLNEIYYSQDGEIYEDINYDLAGAYTVLDKHPNAEVEIEMTYLNGVKHGAYKSYNFNGGQMSTGNYLNGTEHGEWIWYHENGQKERVANYELGGLHGNLVNYYDDGVVEDEDYFDFGKATGTWKSYYRNGSLDVVTEYENDAEHGRKEFYDPSGELQLVRFYQHGRLMGYSYLKDGKELPMIPLENETGKIEAFYSNGKPSRTMEYKNGNLVNDYKQYYSSGELEQEMSYHHGAYHGESTMYFVNGNVKVKENYQYDMREGAYQEYFENGNLKEESNYLNGKKSGLSKNYNSEGELIKEEIYFNGEVHAAKTFI
ncbi:tetratricopeptide repeat protein [Salegentibacter sp. F188]|uniref:Tetratricopeptide repeat protein n=1 Tax=Autumnicola patrickiae TaxID=3075591 RepID=A0ABU3E2R5_9FLAO|nr:tetratricopeptide repeat protein [Salegentibacter sp. F188]MDT0690261.1 tetratricopeptide repeat protein [Salegentibacter sp. F188]